VHLAVVGFGTAWPWALRSLVEIAQIGVDTQFTNLLKPQGTDTCGELLFAVIAIGDDVTEMTQTWAFKFNPGQKLRALFGWSSSYKGTL
jgi:hypothetical protein